MDYAEEFSHAGGKRRVVVCLREKEARRSEQKVEQFGYSGLYDRAFVGLKVDRSSHSMGSAEP